MITFLTHPFFSNNDLNNRVSFNFKVIHFSERFASKLKTAFTKQKPLHLTVCTV
jgi:hypothetical protein